MGFICFPLVTRKTVESLRLGAKIELLNSSFSPVMSIDQPALTPVLTAGLCGQVPSSYDNKHDRRDHCLVAEVVKLSKLAIVHRQPSQPSLW